MRERWPIVTLSEVCTKIQDGAHRSPQSLHAEPGPDRFPYLTSKNIRTGHLKLDTVQYCGSDFHNEIYPRCNPEIGDVLLTKDGANTGNVTINTLDEPFSLLSSVCLLKPNSAKILSRFLYYHLRSKEGFDQICGQMTGAAIKRIILRTIKSSRVPLPSLSEQGRIVAVLDEAFAGIDTAVAHARKNLANARELFETHLNTTFSQKGKGWVEKTLGEFAHSVSTGPFGSLLHKSDYIVDGVPLVNPINIRGETIVPDKRKQIAEETIQRLSNYILKEGDIVIARRGEIGRCAVVTDLQSGWICGTGCFFITPLPTVNPVFLTHLIRSTEYREELERLSTGATMKNLSNKTLCGLRIALPNMSVQDRIIGEMASLTKETRRLESLYQQKLDSLSELKQSILQKAFAGELTANPDKVLAETGL